MFIFYEIILPFIVGLFICIVGIAIIMGIIWVGIEIFSNKNYIIQYIGRILKGLVYIIFILYVSFVMWHLGRSVLEAIKW
jgi:hypothetical protein